jgi:hypothetical protein
MIAELSAFQAAATSLKTAGDIAKALLDLKVAADVQAKVIELNRMILTAQSDAMTAQATQIELLERVRELEGELKGLEDWEAEKQRYGLMRDNGGCMIYSLKQSFVDAGEEPHALCPHCYENDKKSFLQPAPEGVRQQGHHCPKCKTYFRVWGPPEPAPG